MGVRESIIRQAQDKNELIYDFNQRHTAQYKQTQHDFCAGLTLEWLILRLGPTPWRNEEVELTGQALDDAVDLQDVYENQGHGKGFDKSGLEEKDNPTKVTGAVQPGRLVDAAATQGMYFLQIRHDESHGHVVAFRSFSFGRDVAVKYFDANLGSFYFGNSKRFREWFDWVIRQPLFEAGQTYEQKYAHHWTLFHLVPN
jgi:Yersinia/Haemophilus virulence surface antigen